MPEAIALDPSSSFKDIRVQDSARVHNGHVYSNITNNPSPVSPSSQATTPAAAESPVHGKLCQAAKEGQHTTRLETLLVRGADVDARDSKGFTPLHHAASRGDHENVQLLLKWGADVNSRHESFGPPICIAALRAYEEVVTTLLHYKAQLSVSEVGVLGSAMHCAFSGGNTAIVISMAAKCTTWRDLSVVSVPALRKMADRKLTLHKSFSSLSPEDFELGGAIRCCPVLLAANDCHYELLRSCWSGSIDPASLETCNFTPYPVDSPSTIRWEYYGLTLANNHDLGTTGASTSTGASNGSPWSFLGFAHPVQLTPSSTLMMWAAATLNIDLIDYLLEVGADVAQLDSEGRGVLHYAAWADAHACFKDVGICVQRLVEAGATVTAPKLFLGGLQNHNAPRHPLEQLVSAHHPALDPRASHKWGSDIHARCLTAFLDLETTRKAVRTALDFALTCYKFPLDSIELLCKRCAPLDQLQIYKTSILGGAIANSVYCTSLYGCEPECETANLISVLLRHRAEPNGIPVSLTVAIERRKCAKLVKVLLEYGADPDLAMFSEATPRSRARELGREEISSLFPTVEGTVSLATHKRPWYSGMLSLSLRKNRKSP